MSLAGVVAEGARMERIASGLVFTEGPAWDERAGALLFSDIPASRTMRWRPDGTGSGTLDVFRADSNQGNGLYLDRDGVTDRPMPIHIRLGKQQIGFVQPAAVAMCHRDPRSFS